MTPTQPLVQASMPHLAAMGEAPWPWLQSLRRRGVEGLKNAGAIDRETWKYTDPRHLLACAYAPATVSQEGARDAALRDAVGAALAKIAASHTLVFVDGRLAPGFSVLPPTPGLEVGALSELASGEGVAHALGSIAPEVDCFRALNTSLFVDAALIWAKRGVQSVGRVHVLHVSTAEHAAVYPRVLVVAEAGSTVAVHESFISLADVYLTDALCEISVGDNASLRYSRLQHEGKGAAHVSTMVVKQARDSRFESYSANFGGSTVRQESVCWLTQPGASCSLVGLAMARGRQHIDNHVSVEHQAHHCQSKQLFKNVVDGHASTVFSGRVAVAKHAQKTYAEQLNRNLLLSKTAKANTRPTLEILADDVKCSHGATVGQLDDAALFYLRSRGIDESEAKAALTLAFASDVFESMVQGDEATLRDLYVAQAKAWLLAR